MSYHVMNICVHNLFQCLAWCRFLIRVGMKLEGPRRFWCLQSPDQWNSVSKSDVLAEEGERLPAWRCLQVAWVTIIGFESVWGLLFYLQYVMLLFVAYFLTCTGFSQSQFVRIFLADLFAACHYHTHSLKVWIWASIRTIIIYYIKSNAFSIKANNL